MNRLAFLIGSFHIRLNGNKSSRQIRFCLNNKLNIKNLYRDKETYSADVDVLSYYRLKQYSKKIDADIEMVYKNGLLSYFQWLIYHKKEIVLFSIIAIVFFFLNNRLFSIRIDGNNYYSAEYIESYLENKSIGMLSVLDKIDYAKLSEDFLNENKYIKWCSFYYKGNNLYIEIDEEYENDFSYNEYISDVYGTVTDVYVREGTAMVKKGDLINPGDVIIDGHIDITNSYDEIVAVREVVPDGFALVEYSLDIPLSQSLEKKSKIYVGTGKRGIAVSFRKEKLFSYEPSISNTDCDIIKRTVALKLFGINFLKLNVQRSYYLDYKYIKESITPDEAKEILNSAANEIITSYINDGVEILNSEIVFECSPNRVDGMLRLDLKGTVGEKN